MLVFCVWCRLCACGVGVLRVVRFHSRLGHLRVVLEVGQPLRRRPPVPGQTANDTRARNQPDTLARRIAYIGMQVS